jgi:hypothetical protein
MKAKTKLIRSGLQLTILAAAFCLSASAQAQVTLTELGAAPPTVGANDIAQLIANPSPPVHPDDLNYYWDNGSPPGQTFTTGGNASGYTLTSLALQTGGNGGGQVSCPFALSIYSVSGSMATLVATYTVSAFSLTTEGDWIQWTGLSTYLTPNSQYAYSFGRTGGAGWERMGSTDGNPYAGGEIVLIPTAGGAMTFGTTHAWDATFVAGLTTAAQPPSFASLPASVVLYPGRNAMFTAAAGGTPPFTYRWQKNGVDLKDGGNISGATNATLTISDVSAADANSYNVILSNAGGSTNSAAAQATTLTVLAAPAPGSFAESVMTNQPLAYWRFGETAGSTTAYDYAGGLNGTYGSGATLGVSGPQPPDYLGFESDNLAFEPTATDQTWVTIPASNLHTNTVTFVAWLNLAEDQPDWAGILTSRHGSTQAGFNFTSTKNELAYTWNNNTTWQYHTGLIVSNNTWTMVALVVSPTNATFYACDTNSNIRTAVIVLNNNSELFDGTGAIGEDDTFGAGRTMYGSVDEVAVFKHSLTPAQITALWAAGRAAGLLAPSISQSPVPQSLYPGRTAQFSVTASGTPPLSYHWRKAGVPLSNVGNVSGATSSSLSLTSVGAGDVASYDVVVTNSAGSVTSSVAALTLVSPTGGAYEAAVVAAVPDAYWRLNEAYGSSYAFDAYGGYTATYGASAVPGVPGPLNTELSGFESANTAVTLYQNTPGSWVSVPPLNLDTNTVTITAWIYPSSANQTNAGIFFQRQGLTVAGLCYDTVDGTQLGYNWNNSAGAYNYLSGLYITPNQWSFVALVVEPTQATLYLYTTNTQHAAANVLTHPNQDFAGTSYIGDDTSDAAGARIFNGTIDEVAVWKRALTGEQIAALFSAASGAHFAPTIAFQPQSQSLYAGLNAQFTVSAAGSATLGYHWLKNGAPINDSGNVSGTATPALSITAASSADAARYSVVVTNSVGSITSQVATLTVLPASARIVWSAPAAITTVSGTLTQTGNAVGAATFGGTESLVTIPGGGTIDFKADGSVATATGNGTGTGALGLFSTGDANFNVALGEFEYDGGPKTITLTNLLPGHPYSVQLFGLDDRTTAVGSRRALYQDPHDTNDVSAMFYMSNNVHVIGSFTAVTNTQTVIMVLPGADDGITDLGNGNINALVVRDLSPAPNIVSQPVSLTRYVGAPATLTVATYGTPPMYYQWQKGVGGVFANDGAVGTISFTVTTPVSLTIPSLSAADGAEYRLVVTNSSGSVTSQVATLTVLTLASSYATAVIADKPLAYYRLNETGDAASGTLVANDYVGGHNGLYGSAATNGVPGPSGALFGGLETNNTAVETAGGVTNSWVTAPFGSLSTNTVTFTMWLYPIGTQTSWAGLLVTRGGGVEGGLNYNDQSMLGYTWNNNSTWSYVSGLVIPTNEWSFVATVIEPTQATLYLYNSSGQLSATNAIAHTSDVFGGNWLIGADGTGGGRVFNGVIDELAVYTSALTPAQIQQLYVTAGAPPVKLTIEHVGTNVKLTWPQGTLLQADSLAGPWTTNNVASPYSVLPSGAKHFYRVIVQ